MEKHPDYESFSREALIARVHLLEEAYAYHRRVIGGLAPGYETQERTIKYLLEQPDMVVEHRRAYEILRIEVPIAAAEWRAALINLCHHHGVMRMHKSYQQSRYAGAISLDFDRLAGLDRTQAFLTPSVEHLMRTVAASAVVADRLDVLKPDLDESYPWVSPRKKDDPPAHELRYGVTTQAAARLGLLAVHGSP